MESDIQYSQYTDFSALEKNQLILALQEMLRIFNVLNDKLNAVKKAKEKVAKGREKAAEIERYFTKTQKMICFAAGVIMFVMGLMDEHINFLGAICLGFLLTTFSVALFINLLNQAFTPKSNKALADQYRKKYVIPAQEEQKELEAELAIYLQSEEISWAKNALHEKYLDLNVINQLLEYLNSGRADSLKEALNLYEEVAHRERMETMQASILTAAQQTATESAVAAQAALRSAAANEAAAAEARKISQATNAAAEEAKKIRRASNVTAAASSMAAQDIHKMANRR